MTRAVDTTLTLQVDANDPGSFDVLQIASEENAVPKGKAVLASI